MNRNPNPPRPSLVLFTLALGLLAALIAGCSKQEEEVVIDTARPVKSIVVQAPEIGGIRRFPGRIDATNKAELAFRVPGTVQTLRVNEGDQVTGGQVLISLDPTDYEIAVKDRTATFERAEAEFNRAEELVKDGFISKSDYDKLRADWKNAEAALSQAQQDLSYTELSAPFDGVVAERYVQKFEEVQAKQPVLAVQDQENLEVKVDVPESLLIGLRGDGSAADRAEVTASFDSAPGTEYDLRFKEVSTRADARTQTFQVTFLLPAPEGLTVLPGMTATVTADLSGMVGANETINLLPVSALTADSRLNPFVWIIDEDSMTVSKADVEVGRMSGHTIEVKGGIESGSRIATAGVGYLAEGMKVRLMPEREQAEPRPDEVPLLEDPDGGSAPADPGDLTAPASSES